MDVDLLRPGTVPIAPDTVLWFEFLLHHNLLLSHLQKPCPDPSPIELIGRFSDAIADTIRNRFTGENGRLLIEEIINDTIKHPAKNAALKILSLKVAAYIKWNLAQLRNLPVQTQIHLLQDLLYFANNQTNAEIPNIELKEVNESAPPQYLFALVIYHRWLLNVTMHRITSNCQSRAGEIAPADESIICSHENVRKTVDFLKNALTWTKIPRMLTFDCFQLHLETYNVEFAWSQAKTISREEFTAQLNYDLGMFFFYKEEYSLAKEHFYIAASNFKAIGEQVGFIDFGGETLDAYIRACGGNVEATKGNLRQQLNISIVNHFMGITTILQQDNIHKEIPLAQRTTLELDIQGAISSGTFTVARDLLLKIKSLNLIRCVLDEKPWHSYIGSFKNADLILWAIESTWTAFTPNDQTLVKNYLLELILKNDFPDLLQTLQSKEPLSKMFEKSEMSYMKRFETNITIPNSLHETTWSIYDAGKKRKLKLELKQLEQDLISTQDHKEIKELLVKMGQNPLASTVWNVNPHWELPIPLQSVLQSLSRGFLQDFSFVMLSKAREQMLNKNWNLALEFLVVLDKELDGANSSMAKLLRLVHWEVLLIQVTQLLEDWPKSTIDKSSLADACEACLQINDSVLPRTEVTEQCAICLLNLGRWEFLANFDKRWGEYFEIISAIAFACQEIVKYKGNVKLRTNLWDLVLPIFVTTPPQSKRGGGGMYHHDAHMTNLKSCVVAIFTKLRDTSVLTLVISMLTRLHNVLKDESSAELQTEYVILWPPIISNANSYNTKMASEILAQVVSQGLQYYPMNTAWLRLMGDMNFVNGHYNNSMKYYLKSLLIFTDYFNIPLRHDDHVFRRMIKCCMALGCNTQAAVLCQFLEEPDYSLAFRILGEQKYCNDAMDAYYHCIWDTNILEYLIYIHNKRGEFQRRKCAMQVISLLEINSNNNEEIQREASNLRKSIFLRALTKQYVV